MTAALDLLAFQLDGLRLGVPLEAVERVEHACEVTPLPGAPAAVLGVVNLRGQVAAVVDLRRRLGLAARPIRPADALVTLQLTHRWLALAVDEVEGVIGVDRDSLVPGTALIDGLAKVSGLVKTSEGLLLIEDPQQFLDIQDMRALDRALDAGGAA